jgi:AraC family transcriptional regulator
MLDRFDYADDVQRTWRLAPRTVSLGHAPHSMFAAARLRWDFKGHGHVATRVPVAAYDVNLWLRDMPTPPHWECGRAVKAPAPVLRSGAVCITDVSRECEGMFLDPFDCFHMRIGHGAFDEMTGELGVPRVPTLRYTGEPDPTLAALAGALRPWLDGQSTPSPLFLEHLSMAIIAHVAQRYGGMTAMKSAMRHGLSSAQLRRATEMLSARMDGRIAITEIARECGLSRSHFAHAFKQSTGMSPHRWWVRHRLDHARQLLAGTQLPISVIADMCGFFDQSHLSNAFKRVLGATPGQYRRDRQ